MKRRDFQEKQKDTLERLHGVRVPMNVEGAKQKARKTFKQHFGVDWVSKSDEFKTKFKRTMISRHGVEYPLQSQEIKEKAEATCLSHYGVKHPAQSDEVQQKTRNTNVKKYGVEQPLSSEAVRDKIRQTMRDRFGCDNYVQTEEFSKKAKQTCNRKWNTDYYQQSAEYYKNKKWFYSNPKYPGMTFATSWEFLVYDFLTKHNIDFEYQPNISFPYEYKGTHHTYHPDFRVGNKIIEVKGDHFFRINESTGQEEMYCPYKGNLSDEEYEFICGVAEAKHQCMIKNNVIIIRGKDLDNLAEIIGI